MRQRLSTILALGIGFAILALSVIFALVQNR